VAVRFSRLFMSRVESSKVSMLCVGLGWAVVRYDRRGGLLSDPDAIGIWATRGGSWLLHGDACLLVG
jgi:hypothetical protein